MSDHIHTTYDDEPNDAEEIKHSPDVINEILQREEFNCHAEFKSVDESERVIVGYANTKNLDRMDDVVEPSAFKRTLHYYEKNGTVLLHHDPRQVIGVPIEAKIDDKGLRLKARILKGNDPADPIERAWNTIRQRGLRAFSIGFRILPGGAKWEDQPSANTNNENQKPRIRRITDIDLYEVSVVSIPANRQSLFNLTKALLTGTDLTTGSASWYDKRTGENVDIVTPENAAKEIEEYKNLRAFVENVEKTITRANAIESETRIAQTIKAVEKVLNQGG